MEQAKEDESRGGVIYWRDPDPNTLYGGVLFDEQGQVLLRKPRGEYDGYVWTFAKGRARNGQTPELTAFREVLEGTGFPAMILCPVPGSFQGNTGQNGYFVMRPFGKSQAFDAEKTEAVRWATTTEARELSGLTRNRRGRMRDLAVLDAATAAYQDVMPVWEQTAISAAFGKAFAPWGIYLPPEALISRQRGKIIAGGWAIWYLFGADDEGEFLDYYAAHRMTDDSHTRIRADGRREHLPTIHGTRIMSEDPVEDKRLEAEFRARNQRIAKMLEEKGFGLSGDEPGAVRLNRFLYL